MIFYKKDLNWYYKPQNYIIDNFIKKEYDILINLCDSSIIPIKYLVASSLAHFKIGQFEDGFEIYDLGVWMLYLVLLFVTWGLGVGISDFVF